MPGSAVDRTSPIPASCDRPPPLGVRFYYVGAPPVSGRLQPQVDDKEDGTCDSYNANEREQLVVEPVGLAGMD